MKDETTEDTEFSFSWALTRLKEGRKVQRTGSQ